MKSSDYTVESVIVERTLEPWEVELERYKEAVTEAIYALKSFREEGDEWTQKKADRTLQAINHLLNP